jgi:hypothetical protein
MTLAVAGGSTLLGFTFGFDQINFSVIISLFLGSQNHVI